MTSNVIPFKENLLNGATKLQFTHTKDGPIIETTLAENFVIKRFISFALTDVEFQMGVLANSKMPKKKLEEHLYASGFIIEYLRILLHEVELGIKSIQETNEKS